MAMHATGGHFAFVIKHRLILAREAGILFRSCLRHGQRLFANENAFVLGIGFVQFQRRCQCLPKTLERNIFLGVLQVRARPEPPVNGAVGVHEKGGEGQVVIELEQRQVQVVSLHEAHANELRHQILNPRVVTDNLSVKAGASHSRHAPQHTQEWLPALFGFGDSFCEIVVNPMTSRQYVRAIVAHLRVAALRADSNDRQQDEQKCNASHSCPTHARDAIFIGSSYASCSRSH